MHNLNITHMWLYFSMLFGNFVDTFGTKFLIRCMLDHLQNLMFPKKHARSFAAKWLLSCMLACLQESVSVAAKLHVRLFASGS